MEEEKAKQLKEIADKKTNFIIENVKQYTYQKPEKQKKHIVKIVTDRVQLDIFYLYLQNINTKKTKLMEINLLEKQKEIFNGKNSGTKSTEKNLTSFLLQTKIE